MNPWWLSPRYIGDVPEKLIHRQVMVCHFTENFEQKHVWKYDSTKVAYKCVAICHLKHIHLFFFSYS